MNLRPLVEITYPYHMVTESGYGAGIYDARLPSGFDEEEPTHLDRLDLVRRMHQEVANVLIPFCIDPALDSTHLAYGAKVGMWIWPLQLAGEAANIQGGASPVQHWINRNDLCVNLSVQFPPPQEGYMDGETLNPNDPKTGPKFHVPLGKTFQDYEQYNNLGPGGGPTRLIDLFKITGGACWANMYISAIRNIGGPEFDQNWDETVVTTQRRVMVYADIRGIPIIPTISPQTIAPVPGPWPSNTFVTANFPATVVRRQKIVDNVLTDEVYEWRAKIDRTTRLEWDDEEQSEWLELGPVGRMTREEILRPLIHEFRFRYGWRWAIFAEGVFANHVDRDRFIQFLQKELAKPVMSSLADLEDPMYGGISYPDWEDQTSVFPSGVVLEE